jgi:ligand-binding sensor domain-containing protein
MRKYVALAGVAALAFGAWTLYRVNRAEDAALRETRSAAEVRFAKTVLDAALPVGWETVASPADFRDAAIWNGALYLASSNALFRYRADGELDRTWRAGFELPAAPLNALAAEEKLIVATEGEGVLLFDGTQFERLLPEVPEARKIRAVLPLSTGSLLLATAGRGVLRYDGARLRPVHPALSSIQATALAGTDDDLWIGTRSEGAYHLRGGQTSRFTEAERLPDNGVHALAVLGDMAYVGTSTGVAVFVGGAFQRVIAPGVFARSLLARGGEVVVGTLSDGLLRVPSRNAPEDSGEVRRVFAEGGDVYVVRPSKVEVLREGRRLNAIERAPALLTHGNVSALQADAGGRLWVGYFDRGIDIVEKNRTRISHVEDERVFCVNRIVPSLDGQRMAAATANGLIVFDAAAGKQRQVLTKADGLIASHVTDVVARGAGWVAATPAGLTFLDGPARSIYAFHGLVNNHVYTLAARGETLVTGTLGGASVLQGESVKRSDTTANSGLKTNWITAFVRVGDEWWAGTYGGGVQRLSDGGEWRTFEGLPRNAVVNPNAMAVTPTAVYAGTLEHGLLIWNRTSQSWRAHRAGLPSANVTAILYHGNRLYVGTENGLVMAEESRIGQ